MPEEKQLVQGPIGSVGAYDVDFKEGHLVIEVKAAAGPGEAALVLKLSAEKVLDKLAEKIPGKVDDAVFGMLKAALLGK